MVEAAAEYMVGGKRLWVRNQPFVDLVDQCGFASSIHVRTVPKGKKREQVRVRYTSDANL